MPGFNPPALPGSFLLQKNKKIKRYELGRKAWIGEWVREV